MTASLNIIFFLFRNPNVRLGQIPNFYRKFVLKAPLTRFMKFDLIGSHHLPTGSADLAGAANYSRHEDQEQSSPCAHSPHL